MTPWDPDQRRGGGVVWDKKYDDGTQVALVWRICWLLYYSATSDPLSLVFVCHLHLP